MKNVMMVERASSISLRESVHESHKNTENIDEKLPDIVERLNKEDAKFKNFWVGVTNLVESYYQQQRKPERETSKYAHAVQHQAPTRHFLLHPNNVFRIIWDILLLIMLLFSILIIPYRVGFDRPPNLREKAVDDLISIFFGLDMIIQANSSYFDAKAERWIEDRALVFQNYLSFWFWIDFLSTIPWDQVTGFYECALIRLIRILKLYYLPNRGAFGGDGANDSSNASGVSTDGDDGKNRKSKLHRMINKFVTKVRQAIDRFTSNYPTLISLSGLMLQIFFIAHIFACFWHYIAIEGVSADENTWLKTFGYDTRSISAQYVASLYFVVVTMLTIGYGDIYATSDAERVYAIVTMIVGGVIFGALVGQVASAIDKRNPQQQAFNNKMYELKLFLADAGLPADLREKTKSAYAYYLQKRSSYQETAIYEKLTPAILQVLIFELYAKDIEKIRLFQDLLDGEISSAASSIVVHLMIHSRPCQIQCQDVIFAEGDVCNDLVLIKEGNIRLDCEDVTCQDRQILIGYLTQGDMFGDVEYYLNSTAWCTSRAVTYAQLLLISHVEVKNAMEQAEENSINHRIDRIFKQRHANLMSVLRATSSDDVKTLQEWISMESVEEVNGNESEGAIANRQALKNAVLAHEQHQHSRVLSQMKVRKTVYYNGVLANLLNSDFNVKLLMPQHTNARMIRVLTSEIPVPVSLSEDESDDDDDTAVNESIDLEMIQAQQAKKVKVDEWFDWQLGKRWLLHPEGQLKLTWDSFIALLIVYSVLIIPIELAFQEPAFPDSDAVNLLVSLFFFFDILCSFRTCIECLEYDALIVSTKAIAKQYLQFWFWIDFVSTVPWDNFFQLITGGNNQHSTKQLKITQLVKIARLFRLARVFRAVKLTMYREKLESSFGISPVVVELLALLTQVFFIVHLSSCIWWGCTTGMGREPWYVDAIQPDSILARKYLLSIYFTFTTMSTVGYGDLHPQAVIGEQLLGCLLVILGASMFGYMIAKVSSVLNSSTIANSGSSEALNEVSEYLEEKHCSHKVSKLIVNHCQRQFEEQASTSTFDLIRITNCLPPSLRVEILSLVYEKKISKIPIFRHVENRSVIIYLFQYLTPAFYEVNDFIIRQGENANSLIFLVSGSARGFRQDVKEPRKTFDKSETHGNQSLDSVQKGQVVPPWQLRVAYLKNMIDPVAYQNSVKPKQMKLNEQEKRKSSMTMRSKSVKRSSLEKINSVASSVLNPLYRNNGHDPSASQENLPEHIQVQKLRQVPFIELQEEDYLEAGYRLLGDLHPGDFIGHIAFMSCLPHEASVRCLAPTTVYTLSKMEISELIRTEPRVGIQLQAAIARAVIAQSNEVGRFHMRKNRAKFMKSLKYQYLHRHASSVFQQQTHQHQEHASVEGMKSKSNSKASNAHAAHGVTANVGAKRLPTRLQKQKSGMMLRLQAKRNPKLVERLFADRRVWYDSDSDEKEKTADRSKVNNDDANDPENGEGSEGTDEEDEDPQLPQNQKQRQSKNPNILNSKQIEKCCSFLRRQPKRQVSEPNPDENQKEISLQKKSSLSRSTQSASRALVKAMQSTAHKNSTRKQSSKRKEASNVIIRRTLSMSAITSNHFQDDNETNLVATSFVGTSTAASRISHDLHHRHVTDQNVGRKSQNAETANELTLFPRQLLLQRQEKLNAESVAQEHSSKEIAELEPRTKHVLRRRQSYPSLENEVWKAQHIFQGIV